MNNTSFTFFKKGCSCKKAKTPMLIIPDAGYPPSFYNELAKTPHVSASYYGWIVTAHPQANHINPIVSDIMKHTSSKKQQLVCLAHGISHAILWELIKRGVSIQKIVLLDPIIQPPPTYRTIAERMDAVGHGLSLGLKNTMRKYSVDPLHRLVVSMSDVLSNGANDHTLIPTLVILAGDNPIQPETIQASYPRCWIEQINDSSHDLPYNALQPVMNILSKFL